MKVPISDCPVIDICNSGLGRPVLFRIAEQSVGSGARHFEDSWVGVNHVILETPGTPFVLLSDGVKVLAILGLHTIILTHRTR